MGERYLYQVLCEGGFSIGKEAEGTAVWQGSIPKSDIYTDYMGWCNKSGEKYLSKELLGKTIKKHIHSVKDTRPTHEQRVRCYGFSSLQKTREEFSSSYKEKPENIFDNYTVQDE